MEKHLKINPSHLGLRHLWIHLMELSPTPEVAQDECFPERLIDLAPDIGHLGHMATHIDILVGNYESSLEKNKQAVLADEKYLKYRQD